MTPRTKAILGSAATVVIIAAVILGLWAFGSARKVTPPTITVSPQQRSDQALKDGLAALSKEQTGTAVELFESAIRINPDNTAAKDALAKAKSGTSSNTSSTTNNSGSTSTTQPATAAASAVWETKLDIAKLLPKGYTDYALGAVETSGPDAVVSASPSKTGAAVTSVVWAVHDRETDAKAADFITKTTKAEYSKDGKTVTINGVPGYFGTNGTRFATVAFTRGRYAFEVLITTTGSPASQQAFAEKVAAAFATAP